MCGPENTNRPRGGALAVLSSLRSDNTSDRPLQADLAFHTPGSPSSSDATHVRLTPSQGSNFATLQDLHVIIHSTGDLRPDVNDCGLLEQFPLTTATSINTRDFVEFPLKTPLSLQVWDSGIIGRRVSLSSSPTPTPQDVLAQGIIGFNFRTAAI